MSEDVRLWEIADGKKLVEIDGSKLSTAGYKEQDHLEAWLENDIALIDDDLLVIGEQVKTLYGKEIDLLCIDREGCVVIIELKRDKTPREVVAQVLDYASWIKDLTYDDIEEIANKYAQRKSINETFDIRFKEFFEDDLPETINDKHKMLIVASELDEETERIIKYLSETYGVDINFIQFQFFKAREGGKEYMARVFLIDPVDLEQKVGIKAPSKRSSFSLEVGQFQDDKLEKLISESLTRETRLTPRLRKFIEILLSEDRDFHREEVKELLSKAGIGKDVGHAGRLLSGISKFITTKNSSHLRQVIEFSSGGVSGQRKDNYRIKHEYRNLVSDVLNKTKSL